MNGKRSSYSPTPTKPAPPSPKPRSKPSPPASNSPPASPRRSPSASSPPTPQPLPSSARLTGARLLAVSGEAFAQPRYATDAAACEALCRAADATIVLAPASSRFTRVAAGVAHRLGGFIDTHITAIGGTETVEATPLVLSPAHRSRPHPRRPPLVPAARRRHPRGLRRPSPARRTVEASRRRTARAAHHRQRPPRARARRSKPSAPTPSCSSSPAPAGQKSSPTARSTSPKPAN